MKKLVILTLVLAALAALLYFAGSAVLERSTRAALPAVSKALAAHDIVVTDLDFGNARIASLRSVAWENIEARLRLPGASAAQGQSIRLRAGTAELRLADFSFRNFKIDLKGLTAEPDSDLSSGFDWASSRFHEAARQGRLIAEHLGTGLEMDLRDPERGLRQVAKEMERALREGTTTLPLTIDAGVLTQLDGDEVWARLRAVDRGGVTAIEVDREDLEGLAGHFSRPLTEGEIGLVAENPARAPALLLLKKYAENTARDAHDADRSVPRDAYRHVLWSFLLARRFGAEFAETVTDAHEVGITDNTEAEHRMDYNNNAVGRRYAASGLNEGQILERVRTDPAVIRKAR